MKTSSECHCGSGLPFNRCHGALVDFATSPGNLPVDATDTHVPLLGFPGQHQTLHIVNRFIDGDPRNDQPPHGVPGLYQVTFVLHRPGHPLFPEGHFSFSNGVEGDSNLAIVPPAYTPPGNPDVVRIIIQARTSDGSFQFKGLPNGKGFLGKLVSAPFLATHRDHAEQIAFRAVTTSLSDASVHLDIPLEIGLREVTELSTGNTQVSLRVPPLAAPLTVQPIIEPSKEFRSYASLYREALNTNSPTFEFLCLYKIIEAIRARRVRKARAAKRARVTYVEPQEVLPMDNRAVRVWLEALFYVRRPLDIATLESSVRQDVRGLLISDVVKNELLPLRDNIAHALFESDGELGMSSDELLDTHRVAHNLLLTKCIVRRLLKTEFPAEFLSHLPG